MINSQTSLRLRLGFIAGAASLAFAAAAPASAAPSRAELEASVIQLENSLAAALTRLRGLEEQVTGGAAADSVQNQLQSIQSELVRIVGELEETQYQNARLREQVRTLHREIQLRDAEIAGKLGLQPAFTAPFDTSAQAGAAAPELGGTRPAGDPFVNPFLSQNGTADPAAGGAAGGRTTGALPGATPDADPSLAENNPAFFGDDPFAAQRAAATGTLGQAAPLPDDPEAALASAKGLLINGRFDEAEIVLAAFQERFGESPQAAEALYWQGEVRFNRGAFEEAKDLYIDSLQTDPAGPWAPDAMIALASALQNMNLKTDACDILSQFPRQYPNAALSVRSKAERVRQAAACS